MNISDLSFAKVEIFKTWTFQGPNKFFLFFPACARINDVSHVHEILHFYFPGLTKAESQKTGDRATTMKNIFHIRRVLSVDA